MKVGMFFFEDSRIRNWLYGLGANITSGYANDYTEGYIDLRLICLLRILYDNGYVSSTHNAPNNVNGIYVRWKDWL